MTDVLYGPPGATLQILLDDPQEHDSVAKHNAYHFGQIVVIRRVLGS